MVRAHEDAGVSLPRRHLGPLVPADVGEHPDAAVVAPHYEQRVARELGGEVIAGFSHLFRPPEGHPLALEHLPHFEVEHLLRSVGAGRHRERRGVGERREVPELAENFVE